MRQIFSTDKSLKNPNSSSGNTVHLILRRWKMWDGIKGAALESRHTLHLHLITWAAQIFRRGVVRLKGTEYFLGSATLIIDSCNLIRNDF